ncbi:uncharacterized protein LOC132182732 isoform X2 [Corylus avellana]|uniref:uncharacterized protein LOC132182732 isoform X2 n=1 Tax=Corylus avellana TaxID=13451 RepID=UPI00286A692B|nr:uncharacterized protein LOC132182732 isoform X2 [Corylus avellana]
MEGTDPRNHDSDVLHRHDSNKTFTSHTTIFAFRRDGERERELSKVSKFQKWRIQPKNWSPCLITAASSLSMSCASTMRMMWIHLKLSLLINGGRFLNLLLRKQELVTFAKSAEDVLRAVEESAKREIGSSMQSSLEAVTDQPSKPPCERVKIVISVQDKDGHKQFRMYMDDKFERLFKMYADKVKLDIQNLVFCFDGDKISPAATPDGLGMEDEDIIEVHVKSS